MKGQVVLITGASAGIGKASAEKFAKEGYNLALCARSMEKLEELKKELSSLYKVDIFIGKVDVSKLSEVEVFVEGVKKHFGKVDILINNAGLGLGFDKFYNIAIEDFETMIDVNVKGLIYFSKLVLPIMFENEYGHIINIGSLAGVASYPNGAIYCATKAAVKFISDGIRQDTVDKPIKVTNIQPGMVETNFSVIRFHGDKEKADNVYKGIRPLVAEDIAETIYYTASVPRHVQICEVTMTPMHQATGGAVYKKL